LRDELGIETDVEPSGDQEMQEYQNLDKQELINLLMRAKNALGGRVPSPPITPSAPVESDAGVPKVVDAPSYPYLKYNLPTLRSMPNGNRHRTGGIATTPKVEEANKENDGNWNTTGGNSNNWNNNGPANDAAWAAGGGSGNWDGPSVTDPAQPAPSQQGQQNGGFDQAQSRQDLQATDPGATAGNGSWNVPDDIPARPPTPEDYQQPVDVAPQPQQTSNEWTQQDQGNDSGETGWENTNQNSSGNEGGLWNASNSGGAVGAGW